jgi:hypothetical protein
MARCIALTAAMQSFSICTTVRRSASSCDGRTGGANGSVTVRSTLPVCLSYTRAHAVMRPGA